MYPTMVHMTLSTMQLGNDHNGLSLLQSYSSVFQNRTDQQRTLEINSIMEVIALRRAHRFRSLVSVIQLLI